ncbi:phosphoglycerate mutase-like protein [Zopfia rhizophila CBS 207.26]|uniref:Phosphoglycerate mutase-like protein n=1 Tax=Zopfia rhizophila CBS 207.26 TaxID=1314779 RepID=A0A6A6EC94_9PEZI|nr:phosphoglycerate mutase-like protein [Zopfia rhizophila CBS 207.26]
MLALFLAVMAAAWLIDAQDDRVYQPHGAVLYVRSGERTPEVVSGPRVLTALGAQQMYNLGQNVRGRYINALSGKTGLGQEQISGLAPDLVNSGQLFIMTTDQPYLVASAQAFMQGLYPPYSPKSNQTGPLGDSTGILANGSVVDPPLDGYQYPQIHVASDLDPSSIYMAGGQNCPESAQESLMYYTTQQFMDTRMNSASYYEALNASVFDGHLRQDLIDYYNAYLVWDYLSYKYTHDKDVFEIFANDSSYHGVYDQLRYLANEQAWYFYGNSSGSSSDGDTRSMAGRTLAALILGQFQKMIINNGNSTNGNSHPLSLLFGEHEPFISLFSLMELEFLNSGFMAIPPFASSMVFELFSMGSGNDDFPSDEKDLWVRFYFQNGTDYEGSLRSYPMFGRGPSGTDMPWLEFQDMMSRIMTNTLSDWCQQCSAPSIFCWGVDNSTLNILVPNRNQKVTPAVAGVIGAVVTLAVAGLLFALAMLVGGIRFHRVNSSKKSDLGGFKGSAKLASDADLHLPKNGAPPAGIISFGGGDKARNEPRERVGSWELRQKEFGPGGAKSEDLGNESRKGSFEAIEAAMTKPVQPHERV